MTAPNWVTQISPPQIHQLPARAGGPITTPVNWQVLNATIKWYLDTFIGQIAIAFGGIDVFGWHPFQFLVDWGQQRIDDANANYAAAVAAQSTADTAQNNITTGYQNLYNNWYATSGATGTPAEVGVVATSLRSVTVDGYTVETFTTNGSWTVPANLVECWFIVINGGGKGTQGQTSSGGTAAGGAGGVDGGYHAVSIDPATLTPGGTASITVGLAASTAGALGGTTTVGGVSGVAGVGSIASDQGYITSSSKPGSGGNGGSATSTTSATDGQAGASSALAAGGAGGTASSGAGTGNAGGTGGDGSIVAAVKSGGAGGGGGGGRFYNGTFATVTGGSGGNGGYPGGASGGGGAASSDGFTNTLVGGAAGAPASGCAFIMYKTG